MRQPQTPQCSGDPRSITAAPCPRAAGLAQEQQLLPARRHQSPAARLLLNAGSRTRPRETQDAPQRQLDQKQADECKSTGFLSPFTPTQGQPHAPGPAPIHHPSMPGRAHKGRAGGCPELCPPQSSPFPPASTEGY